MGARRVSVVSNLERQSKAVEAIDARPGQKVPDTPRAGAG